MTIERHHHTVVIHRLGHRAGLSPWRCTHFEHPLPGRCTDQARDHLARLILRRRSTVSDTCQRSNITGAGHEQGILHERAAGHDHAGLDQFRFDLSGGGAQGIHPERDHTRFVDRRKHLGGVGRPEVFNQPLHEPVRHRRTDGDGFDVVTRGQRPGRTGGSEFAQDRVHESLGAG